MYYDFSFYLNLSPQIQIKYNFVTVFSPGGVQTLSTTGSEYPIWNNLGQQVNKNQMVSRLWHYYLSAPGYVPSRWHCILCQPCVGLAPVWAEWRCQVISHYNPPPLYPFPWNHFHYYQLPFLLSFLNIVILLLFLNIILFSVLLPSTLHIHINLSNFFLLDILVFFIFQIVNILLNILLDIFCLFCCCCHW